MKMPPHPAENYYRVSIKALIFDDKHRLLLFRDSRGEWEVPGGGLDHTEDYEACIRRELAEEAGAKVKNIGPLAFFYRDDTGHGHPKISIAFSVELEDFNTLKPSADDLVEARFVTKEEMTGLPFQKSETSIKNYADQIWQQVEKNGENR